MAANGKSMVMVMISWFCFAVLCVFSMCVCNDDGGHNKPAAVYVHMPIAYSKGSHLLIRPVFGFSFYFVQWRCILYIYCHCYFDCLPALNFYRIFYTCKVYDDDDYNGMYG